jgi:hypothetical protein
MTKLIAIIILLLVLYGSWQLFFYYERVKNQKEAEAKEAVVTQVRPESLQGLPSNLENSLRAAEAQGATGLRNWLKANGNAVQDPRKAWIELDYCVAIARDNPAEARKLFAGIVARTPPASPVWPRIKQLQPTYGSK